MLEIPQTQIPNQNLDNPTPQPIDPQMPAGAEIPNEVVPPTKKNRKKLIISGGIISVLILIVGGIFAYQKYKPLRTCDLNQEYTKITKETCLCPKGYEFYLSPMGWGSCPKPGMRDCVGLSAWRCEPMNSKLIEKEVVCDFESCHGLDLTCGENVPQACDLMFVYSDVCRQYAKCEVKNGSCGLVIQKDFQECKKCFEECVGTNQGSCKNCEKFR